jgi:hypothetical protein
MIKSAMKPVPHSCGLADQILATLYREPQLGREIRQSDRGHAAGLAGHDHRDCLGAIRDRSLPSDPLEAKGADLASDETLDVASSMTEIKAHSARRRGRAVRQG